MKKTSLVIQNDILAIIATVALSAILFINFQMAQGQGFATFDEIDKDHQPLVEEIFYKTLNHTADRIVITEDPARMTIIYENITVMDNGYAGDVEIKAPHNFTSAVEAAAAQGGGGGLATSSTVVLDEIDEDNQPIIEEIVNKALNQTADSISIYEEGWLAITYYNNTTRSTDPALAGLFGSDDSDDDIVISAPHNFTAANGYEFRDGTIYKPDGTVLFS